MSFTLNPRKRIEAKLEELIRDVKIEHETRKQLYEQARDQYQQVAKKLAVYQYIQYVIAALLYVSVISTVAGAFSPFFEELLTPVVALSQVIGITILSITYFGLSTVTQTLLFDLLAEYTKLVALISHEHNSA